MDGTPTHIIDIQHLTRRFNLKAALQDVTIQVPRGRVFGIVGENGAEFPHYELLVPSLVLLAIGVCLLPRFRRSSRLGALKKMAAGSAAVAALCLIGVWQLNLSFGYQWALTWLVVAVALLAFLPFLLMPVLVDLNRHR